MVDLTKEQMQSRQGELTEELNTPGLTRHKSECILHEIRELNRAIRLQEAAEAKIVGEMPRGMFLRGRDLFDDKINHLNYQAFI